MQGPIYKFYRARWTEAYYQLSQTERDALFAKHDALTKQVGVKQIAFCNCMWNDERWSAFGVEEFADLEAVQKFAAGLMEIDWLRYLESETMLGTAFG
jgi:hypothetical protein